jgi:membrane fusion protein (multidrug efflux system)
MLATRARHRWFVQRRSWVRWAIPIVAILVIVGALGFVKARQIGMLMRAGKAAEAAGPPPEVVATTHATTDTWESTLPGVGSVESAKGVTLSVEVGGVISKIAFESGAVVKKGDVLLELDASVERAQLAAAYSRKKLAATNLTRSQALLATGSLPKAQTEADVAALETANADTAAFEAQIAKKTLRAPFAGKLGIRAVNLGQYLTPGTPVTALETTETQYVDFTLAQQHLGAIAIGMPVRIRVDEKSSLDGAITAIDPTVDPISRVVRVRASAPDKDKKLRPGMFAELAVVLPDKRKVIAVPLTAIVHASYGDSIFVVDGKVARQQFVRTGDTRGDFVAIEEGLTGSEEVVTAGAFKLRNGAPITVNNDVKPAPSVTPKPENR